MLILDNYFHFVLAQNQVKEFKQQTGIQYEISTIYTKVFNEGKSDKAKIKRRMAKLKPNL